MSQPHVVLRPLHPPHLIYHIFESRHIMTQRCAAVGTLEHHDHNPIPRAEEGTAAKAKAQAKASVGPPGDRRQSLLLLRTALQADAATTGEGRQRRRQCCRGRLSGEGSGIRQRTVPLHPREPCAVRYIFAICPCRSVTPTPAL
jgi:hypothetical protein